MLLSSKYCYRGLTYGLRLLIVAVIAFNFAIDPAIALSNKHTKGAYCERILSPAAPKVIRIVSYNTKDLKIQIDRFGQIIEKLKKTFQYETLPKTARQVAQLGEAILQTDPDIIVFQEVETLADLEYLNKKFLDSAYDAIRLPGNDNRGFEIGFLVRKGMPIEYEVISHKEKKWTDPVTGRTIPLFSRDAPALIIRAIETGRPLAVVIGHHARSKNTSKGFDEIDPQANRFRTAQHEGIAKIVGEFQNRYGEDIPIVVAGDFNTSVKHAPETAPLRGLMQDTFDMSPRPLSEEERITHSAFINKNKAEHVQLDGILVTAGAKIKVLRAGVRRDVRDLSKNMHQRSRQISDHFMIFADIELSDDLLK